jgi:molybdenum cofactor cytidylyltransferase
VSDVAAIVLAAGLGSRFGGALKPLAEFRGKPMIRHVCEAALASQARPVLVVLGYRGGEVSQALVGLDVKTVDNSDYAQGLASSLQAGFAALPDEAGAALVLLADMPLVETATLKELMAVWRDAPETRAVIPMHGGKRGNPVLLSRALEPDIAKLTGDQGAGPLLRRLPGVIEMPCDRDSILRDFDTPEALASEGGG